MTDINDIVYTVELVKGVRALIEDEKVIFYVDYHEDSYEDISHDWVGEMKEWNELLNPMGWTVSRREGWNSVDGMNEFVAVKM